MLEDVSDQFQRKQAEARLSALEAQIRGLSEKSKAISETPLQKAIDEVRGLMDHQPELQGPLQEILTQLTSSNVMLPSLMTDSCALGAPIRFQY